LCNTKPTKKPPTNGSESLNHQGAPSKSEDAVSECQSTTPLSINKRNKTTTPPANNPLIKPITERIGKALRLPSLRRMDSKNDIDFYLFSQMSDLSVRYINQ